MSHSQERRAAADRLAGKSRAARFALPLSAVLTALAWLGASIPAHAQLPTGSTVIHGTATVGTVGKQMTVTNSPNAILNWQSFSIGASHAVRFQQESAASKVLNRVTGSDPSQIFGSLTSNGQVWLINPHGVLFGQNARVDVAGLVASTLNIANADFLANRFNFANAGDAGRSEVMNQGEIRTSFGGRVWMIGEQARNEGLIESPGGNIVLAAGKSIELIDSGMPNVIVRVTAPENEAVNLGTLVAAGGSVDLHGGIVNQDGIVRADSVGTDAAGRITLKASEAVNLGESSQTLAAGGDVRLEAGTVNNRGTIGGHGINITADQILQQGTIKAPGGNITLAAGTTTYLDGLVDVSNPQGTGGNIRLSTGKLEGMAGGSLRANGVQGGSIRVEGRGMLAFSSTFSATGTARGGNIEVTGDRVYLLNADVDASGARQGGTVHLGGGWQGKGDLPLAREVLVGVGSEVRANGALGSAEVKGGGGEVVVWSTESSEHYGSLQAKDGGRIELSSQGEIRQTGEIQAGPGGSVLFDPKNLIITDSPPDSLTMARKVVSGSVVSAQPALIDGDFFGSAVALDGDRLAVGAHGDNTGDFQTGAVHLFTGVGSDFSGLTWRKKLASGTGAFGMPTLALNDYFGTSVALKGDLLAVGAPFDDTGGTDRGSVHLFNGVGADFAGLTWQRKLASSTGAIGMPALANSDDFGRSVAIDAGRVAVGASVEDTGGAGRGAVFLFTGVGSDFTGLTFQKKLASGTGATSMPVLVNNDEFGYAVSLDGDRLAVGALLDDTGGVDRGAVHLFTIADAGFTELTWRKKLASASGAIGMPALANSDNFGSGVALNGDQLVVGAPFDDTGGADRGAAHEFTGVGADFSGLAWKEKLASGSGAPGMPTLADGDAFGWAVALDGDRLAVGARLNDTGGINRGAVYSFTGVGTDFSRLVWQKTLASGTTAMPSLSDGDYFGSAVALDGDRLAVGAPRDDTGGSDRGAVHLFTGVGTVFLGLTWQKKLASGIGANGMPFLVDGDVFGSAVALDGEQLAVGAPKDDTGGTDRGAVHLFTGVGTDFSGLSWRNKLASGTGAIGMPVLANFDYFGSSVALDSGRMAVGASEDSTVGNNRGAVHLFTGVFPDFSVLNWEKRLVSANGASGMPALADNDLFGSSVALDGDRLAVGTPNDSTVGQFSGAVHLFTGVGSDFSGLSWKKKLASGSSAIGMVPPTGGDHFGFSVALDSDRLAVGADSDDTGGLDRGAVHLFAGVGTDFSGLTWQRKLASSSGAISMPALANGDNFGSAVALNGDRVVVGASADDTGGPDRGAVYLFSGLSTLGSGVLGVDQATFATNPSGTSYLTPASIKSVLATGSNVTLQANNDITVSSAILYDTDFWGNLTLQAGRNITFDARIVTHNASITAVAGDPAANALFTDPGTPTLTINQMPEQATLAVGSGTATLAAVGGNIINNAGDSAISNTGPGRWLIYAANPASSTEGFTSYDKHYDQPFTAGSVPAYAGSGNWILYSMAPTLATAPGPQTITYGDATAFNPSFTGFIDGDSVATAGISGTAIWTIDGPTSTSGNPTAGIHGMVYNSGLSSDLGYHFDPSSSDELTVNQKTLIPVIAGEVSKVYDRTTAAPVAAANISLAGIVPSDLVGNSLVSAVYDNKNVGSEKTVTVTGIGLTGVDAGNYVLSSDEATNNIGTITPATPTAGLTGTVSKVYDRTTPAPVAAENIRLDVFPGDDVRAVAVGSFYDTKDVGVGKRVTVASIALSGSDARNYDADGVLNGPFFADIGTINPAMLTVGLVGTVSKVYDRTIAAPVGAGNISVAGVFPGDDVAYIRGSATYDNKNVGSEKAVTVTGIELTGVDAGNYVLGAGTATANIGTITPATPTAALTGTVTKVYDRTTPAPVAAENISLNVIPGDDVRAAAVGSFYDTKDVGIRKRVTVARIALSGSDAGNYDADGTLDGPFSANIGTIIPATLTYVAAPAARQVGGPVTGLTGSLSGFITGDSASDSTTGLLAWVTPATAASPAGTYAVDGTGLTATNYVFVQSPGNATALTLLVPIPPIQPPNNDFPNEIPVNVPESDPNVLIGLAPPGAGNVVDATSTTASSFAPLDLSLMSRDEMQRILDSRREFKKKLFADAIFKLEEDPSLADVRPCANATDVNSGMCILTDEQRATLGQTATGRRLQRTKIAKLPQIERKIAVLFGLNQYADTTIPSLVNAISDAEAVGKLLAENQGYEVRVVKNATKADIVRTLNHLATEVGKHDSVIIYYAGHGYQVENKGAGYWLPTDASPDDPARWLSNKDVSKMLSGINVSQLALISDSCYSGAFAREQQMTIDARTLNPADVFNKRSVVVMSSGGEEPVADDGKQGHSIFAWYLMQNIRQVDNWRPGTTIFEQVRRDVHNTFPQTPQYGAASAAGHQGGDYLFEFRQMEDVR